MDTRKVEYQHTTGAMCAPTKLNVYTEASDSSSCSSPEDDFTQHYESFQTPTQQHQLPQYLDYGRNCDQARLANDLPLKEDQYSSYNSPFAAIWDTSSSFQLPAMKLHPSQSTKYTPLSKSEEITLPSLTILPAPAFYQHTDSLQVHHPEQVWRPTADAASSMEPRFQNVISTTHFGSSTTFQVIPEREQQRLSPEIRPQAINDYVYSQVSGMDSARRDSAKPPHSNKPYTTEQVHFMRYMKVDCDHNWKDAMELFRARWPEIYIDSTQCLSSRNYRDNTVPLLDANDEPMFTSSGKPRMRSAKCRDRNLEEQKCFPASLVDKHPEAALKYDWVSKEHKERAYILINQLDPIEASSSMSPFSLPVTFS